MDSKQIKVDKNQQIGKKNLFFFFLYFSHNGTLPSFAWFCNGTSQVYIQMSTKRPATGPVVLEIACGFWESINNFLFSYTTASPCKAY